MTTTETIAEAGEEISRFYLSPSVAPEKMLENMRSALARGLPEATVCKPHGLTLSIAGGGPSLADTYQDMTGYVGAVNGSLAWLLSHEIKPGTSYACAVMDAGAHIADALVADSRVRYYVASICDPAVFDLLEGCDVVLWHVSPQSTQAPQEVEALLTAAYPEHWHAIGGGCTMGLRWINLGYFLGFRRFHLHGLDSSFREGATHAYPDRADTKDRITFKERETRPNFLAQVFDFFGVLNTMAMQGHDVEIEVFGDGLLQDEWKDYRGSHPAAFTGNPLLTAQVRAQALLERLPSGPVCGAEIGIFSGAMSKHLLSRPDLHLLMVDSWEGEGAAYQKRADWHAMLSQSRQERYMQAALKNTDYAADRRKIFLARSLDAAQSVFDHSLDFVFLDADHSAEAIAADLAAWSTKVKDGGLIAGHDYGHPQFPDVAGTVNRFVADNGLTLELGRDFTWFARKC